MNPTRSRCLLSLLLLSLATPVLAQDEPDRSTSKLPAPEADSYPDRTLPPDDGAGGVIDDEGDATATGDTTPPARATPVAPVTLYGAELPSETPAVVFIIDTSGSMDAQWQTFVDENGNNASGYRIDRAKAEVKSAIMKLPDGYMFDVVEFTCLQSALFGSLRPATAANKAAALAWVNGLTPTGATGTGPAVAWALNNSGYQACLHYILITDGAPNCLDSGWSYGSNWEHLNIISGSNSKGAVIDVIAISPDYQDMIQFTQDIANLNGPGTCVIVY